MSCRVSALESRLQDHSEEAERAAAQAKKELEQAQSKLSEAEARLASVAEAEPTAAESRTKRQVLEEEYQVWSAAGVLCYRALNAIPFHVPRVGWLVHFRYAL